MINYQPLLKIGNLKLNALIYQHTSCAGRIRNGVTHKKTSEAVVFSNTRRGTDLSLIVPVHHHKDCTEFPLFIPEFSF